MENLVLDKYRDSNIILNKELHRYSLKDDNRAEFISVTTLIDQYFDPFNGPLIASKLVNTHPRYSHMSVDDLLSVWKQTQIHGNNVHNEIEEHILHNKKLTEPKAKEAMLWLNTYIETISNDTSFKIGSENILYSKELKIAGSIDIILKCKNTNKITLIDWKTSKSIPTRSFNGKMGTHPITSTLEDCKYIKYSIQLNMYAYILEKYYGYTVETLIIAQLRDSNVETYLIPKMDDYINKILENRRSKLCLI